jgi:hypothetical protein
LFCCHIGDHAQGEFLAMFGYRPAMKVENLLKSFYILATGLKNVKKHGVTIEIFLGYFWRLFLGK